MSNKNYRSHWRIQRREIHLYLDQVRLETTCFVFTLIESIPTMKLSTGFRAPRYKHAAKHFNHFTDGKLLRANYSELCDQDGVNTLQPLRSQHFERSEQQNKCFQINKKHFAQNQSFNPNPWTKKLTLTTDASEQAIGRFLLQEGHSVHYVSRKRSSAEHSYSSTTEREALIFVFMVTRHKQFLFSRKFTPQKDHKL